MAKETPGETLTKPARITGIVAGIVAVVMMLTTGLVLSPEGTPLRQEARSLLLPYFGQNWRVFAPNIMKVNRTVEMRAQWRDESGKLVHSGWVPITEIEQRTAAGNVAPSRIEKSSWNASATLLKRFNKLDDTQKKRVQDTFIERGEGGFQPISSEQLVEELGAGESAVILYLRMDYMFMRYMTMYATAGFGKDIERVQWRVEREQPNDFKNRFSDEPQFETKVTTFGWRQSNVKIEPDVINEYREIIERYGASHLFRKAAADAS